MFEKVLSSRALMARDWEDFMSKYIALCVSDPYDEKNNPTGYVNLGTAANNLCTDILYPKLTSTDVWSCDTSLLQYRESYGILRLRKALANVMTEFLESHEPVSADDLICTPGVTNGIDLLAHCLADPGDVFLVPTPMYGRICTDIKQRSLVDVWPIPIINEGDKEICPVLTLTKVIKAYKSALAAGRNVRGIFLTNPNNPLGDIYSPKLLMDIMYFCKKHSLHVIVDEIYALSVFSKTEEFHSVLKFPNIPDPERTHILYGLSKDFGLAGLRVGVIHTKCEQLKKCLVQLSFLQIIPFPVMEMTARLLEDLDWCRNFFKVYQKRLAEKYNLYSSYLKSIGLNVRQSSAGIFFWVDFRHICGSSFEQERQFFNYLIKESHLYINPGKEFFCSEPGWFRMVFTESPDHLNEGLHRLEEAIKKYKTLCSIRV